MKKLTLILLLIFMGSINIEAPILNAQQRDSIVRSEIRYMDGTTYRIFIYGDNGLHVINVSKEKLEMEKLNLEIQQLKKNR